MAAAKAVWRSSSGGGDRREPAWILGFKPKRTNLHEKYDYPGMEEAPEQIVPAALGYSVWVSLPIAELAGRTPKELVADAEGSAALRRWIVARLGLGS